MDTRGEARGKLDFHYSSRYLENNVSGFSKSRFLFLTNCFFAKLEMRCRNCIIYTISILKVLFNIRMQKYLFLLILFPQDTSKMIDFLLSQFNDFSKLCSYKIFRTRIIQFFNLLFSQELLVISIFFQMM